MSQLSSRNPHHETSSAKGQPEQDSSLQRGNGNEIRSFEELSEESQAGLFREFFDFLCFNKKWWLTPIILALLLVGVMIFLTTTGAAPFLYTFW